MISTEGPRAPQNVPSVIAPATDPYRRMMDRPELVHGIGLTTDIPATVERTLGCLSRA